MRSFEQIFNDTASGPHRSGNDLETSLTFNIVNNRDVNYGMLVGGALGICAEAGEFADLVKKHLFQDKPLDRVHAKKELADILWHLTQAATGLDTDLEELNQILDDKLGKRFPNGYTAEASNNRAKDDL